MSEVLIQCPKCNSKYKIDSNMLQNKHKLKCTECNNVWEVEQIKAKNEPNKNIKESAPKADEKNQKHAQPTPNQLQVVEKNTKNVATKSLSSKTFSFILFISIAGNVLFWVAYFLNFYCNIKILNSIFGA